MSYSRPGSRPCTDTGNWGGVINDGAPGAPEPAITLTHIRSASSASHAIFELVRLRAMAATQKTAIATPFFTETTH